MCLFWRIIIRNANEFLIPENKAELTMLDELFLAFQINFHHHKYIQDL